MTLAVQNGHTTITHLFLEPGISIPVQDSYDSHCDILEEAAKNGYVTIVQQILEHGKPPGPCTFGWALSSAAEQGHLSMVKALVETLRDKRHLDDSGDDDGNEDEWRESLARALCKAAAEGHLSNVEYLVEVGVSPNTDGYYWDTPLSAAAKKGRLDILQYLLTHGDVNYVPGSASNYFDIVITTGQTAPMKVMLEFVDFDLFASKSDREQVSVLCATVACESETHIERLLQSGVSEDFHVQGYLDDSHSYPIYCGPLELAARTGNEKLVFCLLVDKTARRSSQGYGSPLNDSLRMAIYGGHEHIVKLLLDHGAEPDCRDRSTCLPLNIAIAHDSIFKLLLERGAVPKSENEVHPFHNEVMEAVIKAGKVTLVQELLDYDVPIERTGLMYHVLDGGASML